MKKKEEILSLVNEALADIRNQSCLAIDGELRVLKTLPPGTRQCWLVKIECDSGNSERIYVNELESDSDVNIKSNIIAELKKRAATLI